MRPSIGYVLLGILVLILILLLFPSSGNDKESAKGTACLSNVKQLALGLNAYAEDADGRYPVKNHWTQASSKYWKGDGVWRCLSLPAGEFGYAFNSKLSAAKVPEPSGSAILVFESTTLTPNAFDPFLTFPNPGRHRGRGNLAYADGHAKKVTP